MLLKKCHKDVVNAGYLANEIKFPPDKINIMMPMK